MPLYEYVCQECGTRFDALRQIREADLAIACKHCQSLNTIRKLSVFFAQSGGKVITGTNEGCGSCAGGNCAHCNN